MPIWPHVMAGKNDNKLHQDYVSCKGTGCLGGHITIFHVCFSGHLAGCLGGHIAIFHVCFSGHLAGHITIFHACFGGHLAGCCACALPGEILYILPELATMSVLGS